MSEQDQDASMGRFLREHAGAKRTLAAMQIEIDRYSQAFKSLGGCLSTNVNDEFNLITAKRELDKLPLSDFDFGKLRAFLEEYTELRKSITSGTARLRQLGIDAV